LLKFQFRDLTVPSVSTKKAQEKVPEAEPEVAIQVATSPVEINKDQQIHPRESGAEELVKP
jgi:hypothetical protein